MYCISCGTVIPDGAAFCTECGAPQSGNVNQVPAPQTTDVKQPEQPENKQTGTQIKMKQVECEKKSAVVPFVFSILGLAVVRGVLGLVFSIISLVQSKAIIGSKNSEASTYDMAKASKIFAIIGLIINIIYIAARVAVVIIYFIAIVNGTLMEFINFYPAV